jgi:hypothetical protein
MIGMGSVLEALTRLAAPGAALIGSGRDPTTGDDRVDLDYPDQDRAAGRHPGHWHLRMGWRGVPTPWFDWLYLSLAETQAVFG